MQDKRSRIKQSELCFVCIEFQFHTFLRIPIPIKLCKQIILTRKIEVEFGGKGGFLLLGMGPTFNPSQGCGK